MKVVRPIFLLILVGFFQPTKSISPEKLGDYINLAVTIIPYIAAMITYQQRQCAQKNQKISEKDAEKQYPYAFVGFGSYGISMLTYVASMFLTQKYLWFFASRFMHDSVIAKINYPYPLFALFGALMGTVSMGSGLICSKLVTNLIP